MGNEPSTQPKNVKPLNNFKTPNVDPWDTLLGSIDSDLSLQNILQYFKKIKMDEVKILKIRNMNEREYLKSEQSRNSLNGYSIFEAKLFTVNNKLKWINTGFKISHKLDRCIGCIVGMALGDAIGHPLEFLDTTYNENEYKYEFNYIKKTYTNEYNKFRLERGQWTDDCSMGLCIADSLIINNDNNNNGYDGSDIRSRFWHWWHSGYNNAFRYDNTRFGSVGLGGNISQSIYNCKPGVKPDDRYIVNHENEDSGNGSLMRLAPIPIYYRNNMDNARKYSAESSFTTHPGYIASEACMFMTYIIVKAINAPNKELNNSNIETPNDATVQDNSGIIPDNDDDTKNNEQKQNNDNNNSNNNDSNSNDDIDFIPAKNVKKFIDVVCQHYLILLKKEINDLQQELTTKTDKQKNKKSNDISRIINAKKLIIQLIECKEDETSKELNWNWNVNYNKYRKYIIQAYRTRKADPTGRYNGYPISAGYWGAYCMDGLAMALNSVYNTTNFGKCIENCVNLLGDADSTASIAGQIAGAIYGYKSIIQDKKQQYMVYDWLYKWDHCDIPFRGLLLGIMGDKQLTNQLLGK